MRVIITPEVTPATHACAMPRMRHAPCSLTLAFHDARAAARFAADSQLALLHLPWPEELLAKVRALREGWGGTITVLGLETTPHLAGPWASVSTLWH